jgi:mannose-6-phosphate isomerase-like protein (cupin superfamily)
MLPLPSPAPTRAALVAAALAFSGCHDPAPSPAASASIPASAPAPPPASASAAPPPVPVDAALPATPPHALDRRAECARDTCTLAHIVPDEVRPALSDGAPVVVWEQSLAERASVAIPRDEGVEVMGVVLDGSLDLTPMEEAPKARTVGGRFTAFRAPGGGVTLTGTGGKAARAALVVAVADGAGGLGAHLDQRDRPGAPPSWSWNVRRKRIDTLAFADLAPLSWGGGAYHARIGWEASRYRWGEGGASGPKTWEVDDHPAAVVDLLVFSRSAGVAEHAHDHAWEILAVLEGSGVLARRPEGAEERVEAHPGSVITLPAGVRHAWLPSGTAPLVAIQVYAPPGPEQRFKKLAGKGP